MDKQMIKYKADQWWEDGLNNTLRLIDKEAERGKYQLVIEYIDKEVATKLAESLRIFDFKVSYGIDCLIVDWS